MNPLVSVVVEMGTRQLTGRVSLDRSLESQLEQADDFERDQVEFILVGAKEIETELLPGKVRSVGSPQLGYYGWKNSGARAAKGKYIAFWDSDCRPGHSYLRRAVDALENDESLPGVTGRTAYDGSTLLTRLNTVLSFGYLYQAIDKPTPYAALAHNVVIRKKDFPANPFGPYVGRSGGDAHLTQHAEKGGQALKLDPGLWIFHEDPSFSLTALVERHLREFFNPFLLTNMDSSSRALRLAWHSWSRSVRKRVVKLFRYGPTCGLKPAELWSGVPVIVAYSLIDLIVMTVLSISPKLLNRWLQYQFGPVPFSRKSKGTWNRDS